ncbi:MAG TPA: VWA domain-containing protein, partial [Planctomycetota bacterium]|nr:VWA domain-containing protein [Planctomycetota bacterium]
MNEVPETPAASADNRVAWLEVNGERRYFDLQHRLLVGCATQADVRLEGEAVQRLHCKVSLQPDGSLLVVPIDRASYRVDGERTTRPRTVQGGSSIGIGLSELGTGVAPKSFAHDLRFAFDDLRRSLRRAAEHAAWVGIPLLVHLLLLWIFFHPPRQLIEGDRVGNVLEFSREATGDDEVAEEPEEVELRESYPELATPEVPLEMIDDKAEDLESAGLEGELSNDFDRFGEGLGSGVDESLLARFSKRTPPPKDAAASDGDGPGSKDRPIPPELSKPVRETVADLRRTGLEIVFCFDSTGSMGPVLDDAKDDMLELFDLMHELVPTVRLGIVTYRDRGDSYVTRETRLGIGRFEALAFLSSVTADGGGDYPEAVEEALNVTRKLPWKAGSRKVAILIGDAPPHREHMSRAVSFARAMTKKNGQVHVLVSGNAAHASPLKSIASAGGGRFLPREGRYQLALQLLVFALGPEAQQDLEKLLLGRREQAKRLRQDRVAATLPDVRILARNLERDEPDPVIVEAWSHASPSELRLLERGLTKAELSREGMLALHYLVNRV